MDNGYEKRGYLLEDFRLFHLQDAQGTKIDFHYHEFCKLLLLRSGAGGYNVEGQRYNLVAGDVVLLGSRCVHRPEFEPGVAYERTIIYISPDFLQRASTADCTLGDCFDGSCGHVLRLSEATRRRLFTMADTIIYISPDFLQRASTADCTLGDCFDGSCGHVLRLSEATRRRLFTMADELEQELSGDGYGRGILGNALLLRLLVEIGRNIRLGQAHALEPLQPSSDRIMQILRYLDAHLTEELSIDDLAQRFYLSKYHMMRLFRRETGDSIHAYISHRRLLYARSLIDQGVTATEAQRFYLSKYHMMRLFRRETGDSIHAYISHRRLLYARSLIDQGVTATEACFRCGWQSYSSFTRAYAKRFGATPTGRRGRAALAEETFE